MVPRSLNYARVTRVVVFFADIIIGACPTLRTGQGDLVLHGNPSPHPSLLIFLYLLPLFLDTIIRGIHDTEMNPLVYTARNQAEFRRLSGEHGGLQLSTQLQENELSSSASRWAFRHLLGFRLLTLPERTFLSVLNVDHKDCCTICNAGSAYPQKVDHYWTNILTSDCPIKLLASTDSELLRLPGGFFWVALARVSRDEIAVEARVYPERERRSMRREGYVDSTTTIIGSSSPAVPSSSEFEVELEDSMIDEDEHDTRRSKPEEVTVHLVLCFLQFVLHLCLSQNLEERKEVRPRVERRKATTRFAGVHEVVAEDDGGICRMDWQAHGWMVGHPYIAILEAKSAFKYIYVDERTGDRKPVVSNETLAQYLGEAVVSWRANQDLLGQE